MSVFHFGTPSVQLDNMAGRVKARKVVDEIAKKNGYISPILLNTMTQSLPQESLDELMALMKNLQQQAAASVKTLAQNLYSSSAKFVFELLQNYDDNHYSNKPLDPPSVAFAVYPNRILASCNEEGFTEANVRAICSLGQSSKKKSQNSEGYTGEKGIGFKSVFMAAEDVRIQSRDYSFRFQYPKGDSGLGMTTPIWTDHDGALDASRSHIHLTLRRDGAAWEADKRKAIILDQFQNIHDSILLFMRKLQRIEVSVFGEDDVLKSVTLFSVERGINRATVTKKRTTFDDNRQKTVEETVRRYIIIKHVAKSLAPNENREYLDGSGNGNAQTDSSTVILGFPIDENDVPVIRNEHIFAFLPVKQMGFKFLIHADFVTQANREDIVTTSQRNLGLAEGIADAFIEAIKFLRYHTTLRYKWMRYLPHENDYPWGSFWHGVLCGIRDRLALTPILISPNPINPHRLICESRLLPEKMLDSLGRPLIPDMIPECYLSQEYERLDLRLLHDYGLADLSSTEWLQRVQHDLKSANSVIKSPSNQDTDRVAGLLVELYNSNKSSPTRRSMIRGLQIVPLRDSRWVSARDNRWVSVRDNRPLYYPQLEIDEPGLHLEIPLALDMDVVDASSAARPAWRCFYDCLGVQAAPVKTVRNAILDKYALEFGAQSVPILEHHQFLYQSHHLVESCYDYESIWILDQSGIAHSWEWNDFYIADGSPYGVELLLPSIGAAPELASVLIMNDTYFRHPPSQPSKQSLSWKDWFHTFFRVRRHLRLINENGKQLSAICNFVARHHPQKFLGLLQATWRHDMITPGYEETINYELGCVEVLCRDGKTSPLGSTYFPLQSLQELCNRFLSGESFPWLALENDSSWYDSFPPAWVPLGEALGLGYRCEPVTFLLDVLRHIVRGNSSADRLKDPKRIYELYIRLHAEVRASSIPEMNLTKQIRSTFMSESLLYIPPSDYSCGEWISPDECISDAPIFLASIPTLGQICAQQFPDLYHEELSSLQGFFSRTLGVRYCKLEDLVDEVIHHQDTDVDFDELHKLYTCIFQWQTDLHEKDPVLASKNDAWLKEQFTTFELVCGFEHNHEAETTGDDNDGTPLSWYSPTKCLWTTSSTKIPGMLTLNGLYPELRSFFVDKLGVQTMTAKMVYDKLIGSVLSVEETRQTLQTFNALLSNSETVPGRKPTMDVTALLAKPIFPVKMPDGSVQLCRGTDDFALIDRVSLAKSFAGRAKLLDFNLEEVRDLNPFLRWAGLQNRGLSKLVKEISCVAGDDSRPISSRDRSIRNKARALFSLALAYKSPRARVTQRSSLYALLRAAETLETDRITSELHLHQDRQLIKVERATATFHIQDTTSSLVVYVPRDEIGQDLCFNGTLPGRFSAWLMTDPLTQISEPLPPDMAHMVQSVLCGKRIAMERILDFHGIVLAAVPSGEDDESDDDEDVESDEINQVDTPPENDGHDSDRSSYTVDEEVRIVSMLARTSLNDSAVSRVPVLGVHPPTPTPTAAEDGSYTNLLECMVSVARQTSIHGHGTFETPSRSTEMNATEGAHRWLRNTAAENRNARIGAAGELFVFELLSRLRGGLPGFSRNNWQSTIRGYARDHVDYADMPHWTGRETADITYEDTGGVLTALLIQKGYLSPETWSTARPRYYIEVKTTINAAVETPFFMSGNQYTRMQNSSENESQDEIYIIFRVFGLRAGFVRYQLLVDPEGMRRRGQLAFTSPESWSVAVVN